MTKTWLRYYLGLVFPLASLPAAPSAVSFIQNQPSVDGYSFVEVEMRVAGQDGRNPFTDVMVEAEFGRKGSPRLPVDGFCDSPDGSVYRVRFMPTRGSQRPRRVPMSGDTAR